MSTTRTVVTVNVEANQTQFVRSSVVIIGDEFTIFFKRQQVGR